MGAAPQALLLSTIATDPNDWHIGRFSLLADMIRRAGQELDPSFSLNISGYLTSDSERQTLQADLAAGRSARSG